MTVIILVCILIYSFCMIGVGFYYKKRASNSLSDYWVAGRNVKSFIGGAALYSTFGSAHTLMGVIGLGYTLGLAIHQYSMISAGLGMALGAILLGAPLQKYGKINGKFTLTDYLSDRYNSKSINILVSFLIIITLVPVIGMQIYAGALATSYLIGVPYETIAIILVASFLIYTSIGGMHAITITNVIQTFLMIIFTLVPAIAVLSYFGGFSNLMSEATTNNPIVGGSQLETISLIGGVITFATYALAMPTIIMRIFTSNNIKSSRISLAWGGIFGAMNYMFAIPIVLGAVALFPALDNADFAYIAVAQETLPVWLVGACVVAIFAALMSTTDAMLLAVGASVGRDIVNVVKPNVTDQQRKRITIVTQLIVAIIALLIALNPPGLISIIVSMVSGAIGATFGPALIGGLWWKGATKAGAIASILVGLATNVVIVFGGIAVPPLSHPVFAVPLAVATFILVSLMTRPPDEATIYRTCTVLHSAGNK